MIRSNHDRRQASQGGLYIVLISVHGLIRAKNIELGRDADTGGQVRYVLELAGALAEHTEVGRVDLLTRQVCDKRVSADYASRTESVSDNARIVRLPCGPKRYLRKEALWPHLDSFADQALPHFRSVGRVPDVIHGHYADGGYVGARLASLLGVPFVFTGHSLGRVKHRRLLDKGLEERKIETQYHMTRRIEAEELALDNAACVVASTYQEIQEQYAHYDNYQPKRMIVIAPGLDLGRFHPPRAFHTHSRIQRDIERFLEDPGKPMILALSRADERKNIATLVKAYGQNAALREKANLVIIAGTRDDLNNLDKGTRGVLEELFYLIDLYDLHGHVAYPKAHQPEDVPELYQLAARSRGLLVNPALTEPFGLTLLEAAASGLPVIATRDGGPRDILRHCRNGKLIDPLDVKGLGNTLLAALRDRRQWRRWAKNGLKGAHEQYSWAGHVDKYVARIAQTFSKRPKKRPAGTIPNRLATVEKVLVCDIDNTLLGDRRGLEELMAILRTAGQMGFGIATGRNLGSTLRVLREWRVPLPDLLITSVGSEIHYGPRMIADTAWIAHSDYRWDRDAILSALHGLPGLKMQDEQEQGCHKISYIIDPTKAPTVDRIKRHLRHMDLHANIVYSHQAYLDLLPIRVSKGHALRYVGLKWGLPPENFLAAGDSGNDIGMLSGDTLGVVVANHSPELEKLKGSPRILFSGREHAWGIIDGLRHFNFLGETRIPGEGR